MRKFLVATAAITLMMTMPMLTSCTSDNNDNPVTPPEQEPTTEYTIMYYGHGGGNLDNDLRLMISDFYKANYDAFKKVNVVAQYKFSTTNNLNKRDVFTKEVNQRIGSKTIRWSIDPTKTFDDQALDPGNLYGEDNADITCPDSLTNFIKWAAKAYPAKKYMLIINDHGGGYMPHDELPETTTSAPTRGLIYDDGNIVNNEKNHFTAKTFKRAITNAGIRFETIYMMACLMNNLEYQFELKDLCDYVIASTFLMPGVGGVLNLLPEQLSQPKVDIEQVLSAYCKADVESWDEIIQIDENKAIYTDLTVTRTANIEPLGEMMRQFTDRLCNTYANGTEHQKDIIDSCTAHSVKIQLNRPYYDVAKYMSSIIKALPEVYGEDFFNQMKETFNSCLVAQNYSKYLTAHDYMVDYSVLLGANGSYSVIEWGPDLQTGGTKPMFDYEYGADGSITLYSLKRSEDGTYYDMGEPIESDFPWGSTLTDTYEQLEFDRIVGWSRWLRLNRQYPNIFCPSGLNYQLPMPETETQN